MSVHAWLQGAALASRRIFTLLVCFALVVGAAAGSSMRSIDVAHNGETYVVTVHMFAPVSNAIAWEVLTDFTHMAAWVPNLRESNVIKSGKNQLTIKQIGSARLGPFSFPYTSVREIVMNPQTAIESKQVQGEMRRQQSLMTLGADAGGTQLGGVNIHVDSIPPSGVRNFEMPIQQTDAAFVLVREIQAR